jgi:guanosine-3',5'-bis(diphosphate) 3'-pyrophosphohydrolase
MKKKFRKINRSSGERYFEHLRAVVNNILELPNPNTEKILIAIAHDAIEDTNKTYEGLTEDYGYEIALSVQAISKNAWQDYQNA